MSDFDSDREVESSSPFFSLAVFDLVSSRWAALVLTPRLEVAEGLEAQLTAFIPCFTCVVGVSADDNDVIEAALRSEPVPTVEQRATLYETISRLGADNDFDVLDELPPLTTRSQFRRDS